MAQEVNLLASFVDGQGAGASTYVTYAADLDTNFADIETTINQLVNETKATLSTNSLFVNDLLHFDDPTRAGGIINQGVMGTHSYEPSLNASPTGIDITAGAAQVNNLRVTSGSTQTVVQTGNPADGYYWVVLNSSSALTLVAESTGLAADEAVLAVGEWDNSANAFVAVVRALEASTALPTVIVPTPAVVSAPMGVFFDGDAWDVATTRAASSPAFGAKTFGSIGARIRAIERALNGETTDSEGGAIGALTIEALSVDTTLGVTGTSTLGVVDAGSSTLDALIMDADGSAATPVIRRADDTNTGFFWGADDVLGVSVGGSEVAQYIAAQLTLTAAGAVGTPQLARSDDPNTGLFFEGSNVFSVVTNGSRSIGIDGVGTVDLNRQPRFDFERAAVQSVATGTTLARLTLDTENTDVGSWGAVSTATITVPAGADGFYAISCAAIFAANATGQRRVAITLNGATTVLGSGHGEMLVDAAAAGATHLSATAFVQLAAADVLSVSVAQDSGGNLDVQGSLSGSKIA